MNSRRLAGTTLQRRSANFKRNAPQRTVRFAVASTTVYRLLHALVGILSIVGALVIVFCSVTNLNSGAFYRSSFLLIHGIYAMTALSAALDEEIFDIVSALVVGVGALGFDVVLAITEIVRHTRCPFGVTQTDVAICNDVPSQSIVLPIVAPVLAFLALLGVVTAVLHLSRRRSVIRALARIRLENDVRNGKVFRTTQDAQLERQVTRRLFSRQTRLIRAVRNSGGSAAVFGVAILMTIVLLAIAILNLVFFRGVALYRGALFIIPAHFAGMLIGFFRREPGWWRWLAIVFGLLSIISSATAAIVGWLRFIRCLRMVPLLMQIEVDICSQEGTFRSAIVPVAASLIVILSLVGTISLFSARTRN